MYCSRFMTDWDKYLPQVVRAYNRTQHSTAGISPFMMLTGRERAIPLTFFNPEYEGKKTSPQAYVKEAVTRQQELNELCRRNATKKLLKKWRGPFMITEVHQQGRFYRLSTGRAAHYESLKPHVPSPEDWCIPQKMEGLEYLW